MATTTSKPNIDIADSRSAIAPAWPEATGADSSLLADSSSQNFLTKPSQHDALHALLAFSALHEQVRRRKALAIRHSGFDSKPSQPEFEPTELFVLDEVLQLVAERAVSITGADGLAIALAENNEIVLRAAAGAIRPDIGARIDRDSAFSGACFRSAQIVICDDTETDTRVNLQACRKLGARSMVAVPLCGRRRVIGVLEAFSSWPFAFNESDVRNLSLLAELVLAALKPEDEDRFAQSAQQAATKLETPQTTPVLAPTQTTPVLPEPTQTAAALPSAQSAKLNPETVKSAAAAPATPAQPAAPAALSPLTKAVDAPAQPKPLPVQSSAPTPATVPVVAAPKTIEPASKIAKASALEVSRSAELTAKEIPTPAPTFGQLDPEATSERPWLLLMLVGVVIAAAFTVGVWWKIKTAQIGGAMVQNQQATPASGSEKEKKTTEAVSAASTNPSTSTDALSGPSDDDDSPASPQELSKFPRVTGVRHWSSADSSTVVLDLEDQVQYEPGHLSNPDRVYFDLRDTQLAPELQGKSFDGDALLSKIRVAQPVSGMTRVVLEAKPGATLSAPQVSLERDPYRLVIQVSKAGVTPKTAINLFPNAPETEKTKLAITVPPPGKEDLQLRARVPKMRIVVDAGHGGWDLGTVGRRGLLEKDLVLEIAQRLGKLLETRLGSEVIYTRQDDNYIPLDERAAIANQSQADLFISVHANYSDLPSARSSSGM